MSLQGTLSGLDVATSGLAAEQKRMTVIMENIANSHITRVDPDDPDSGPYVRKRVFFREALSREMNTEDYVGRGVEATEPILDGSGEFPKVLDRGHPDADAEGYVRRSNVNLVYEMLDLTLARRSYEANLATFRTWQNIARKSVELMKS